MRSAPSSSCKVIQLRFGFPCLFSKKETLKRLQTPHSGTSADQLSTMNSMLTNSQQKTICSQLGRVKLQLLYKASIHGFTGAAFHQRCDNRCPTVSVGYNASGYVFGGYTKQPFSQSGQYVHDDQAFLFTFSGEKLIKYPVTIPANAVRMMANCGPYFGETFVLVNASRAVVYTNPGNYYNLNAAEMHGNDLNLAECEVYEVEEIPEFEKPWRPMVWETEKRTELMDGIKLYCPMISSVSQVRVLLIGPVGAGKSSFFNSINSVFRGHVSNQAIAGSSTTSLTTKFRTYSVKAGRGGKPLPIIFCDTMGLEENTGAGLDIDDIISILKGHLPDSYQFNPSAPLHPEASGYRKSPELKDEIHCVVYVTDACKVSIMPTKLELKLEAIRRKVNSMGIPQLILLTKVDEACTFVSQDVRNIYKSCYIEEMMQEVSARLGVPMSCVVPVKNYSKEFELDLNCDILLLTAVIQMLRAADSYFDELSDRKSNIETKEYFGGSFTFTPPIPSAPSTSAKPAVSMAAGAKDALSTLTDVSSTERMENKPLFTFPATLQMSVQQREERSNLCLHSQLNQSWNLNGETWSGQKSKRRA
ncbi:interferon-induced protein 44-like isoform X6 [Perca fluviatilis]|uniref:interferon-induced protein 44-like isoform X6 n=1 Tax=Perca fluviatilis TaxID=8168 RepID=UPI0019636E10|nr:interferon-induced protein 44-like isoform X6 [Perca fluviatilis]